MPTFCLAMFFAYLEQAILELFKSDHYVDRKTVTSVSGLCADYLVVAGISAI